MIIGLAILVGLVVYLLVSLIVIWLSVRTARRHGKSGWRSGLIAAAVMYLLVFWDWIPTDVMYRYDCSSKAGFTQYETLEQWKAKNPGVAETLKPSRNLNSTRNGNRERYQLNQRFAWDIIYTKHPLHILEREERIVDTKTGDVLARYVDFSTTQHTRDPHRFFDLKIWVGGQSCEASDLPEQIRFNGYQQSVQLLGSK